MGHSTKTFKFSILGFIVLSLFFVKCDGCNGSGGTGGGTGTDPLIVVSPNQDQPIDKAIGLSFLFDETQTNFSDEDILSRLAIINEYMNVLDLGITFDNKNTIRSYVSSGFEESRIRSSFSEQMQNDSYFNDNDTTYSILLNKNQLRSNEEAKYVLNKISDKHHHMYIGSNTLIDDPMLFLHEFFHTNHKEHINQALTSSLNILSECGHYLNYTITKKQLKRLHGQHTNSVENHVTFSPLDIYSVYNSCLELNAIDGFIAARYYDDPDSIHLLCQCPRSEINRSIVQAQMPVQTAGTFAFALASPNNDTRLELEPFFDVSESQMVKIFAAEYKYFLKGTELIKKKDFIERKIATLRSIRKKNIITTMLFEVKMAGYLKEFSNEVYTDDYKLSELLNFIKNRSILVSNSDFKKKRFKISNQDLMNNLDLVSIEVSINGQDFESLESILLLDNSIEILYDDEVELLIKAENYIDKKIILSELGNNSIITLQKTPPPPPITKTIHGFVINKDEVIISGAKVSFYGSSENIFSDPNGIFTFKIPRTVNQLNIEAAGYYKDSVDVSMDFSPIIELNKIPIPIEYITGFITENGSDDHLSDVAVRWEGFPNSTISSGPNGDYKIKRIPGVDTLVFNLTGYFELKKTIGTDSIINVKLLGGT